MPFPRDPAQAERGYELACRNGSRADPKMAVLRDCLATAVRRFLPNAR